MTIPLEVSALEIHFEMLCPALAENVIMYKHVWYGHILDSKNGHPYMASKIELVKRVIAGITSTNSFFRLSKYQKNEWFTDFECVDFKPMGDFLRIAFKRENGIVMITTTHHQDKGILKYES